METELNEPDSVGLVDNKQPSTNLRALISYRGVDPRTMTAPKMPFIGQIVYTMTDNTFELGL